MACEEPGTVVDAIRDVHQTSAGSEERDAKEVTN